MQCRILLRVLGNHRGGAIILQGSPVVARTPETPLNNPFLKNHFMATTWNFSVPRKYYNYLHQLKLSSKQHRHISFSPAHVYRLPQTPQLHESAFKRRNNIKLSPAAIGIPASVVWIRNFSSVDDHCIVFCSVVACIEVWSKCDINFVTSLPQRIGLAFSFCPRPAGFSIFVPKICHFALHSSKAFGFSQTIANKQKTESTPKTFRELIKKYNCLREEL